ncbi:MAG: ABC transporter substrate-binding protein [Spirochaetales bacterium]
MKKAVTFLTMAVMLFAFMACTPKDASGTSGGSSNTLVVYSPHDASPLNDAINGFKELYPDITVEVVAAGTGELLNRVRAESAKPIADVLWGGGADSLAAFSEYFAPYESIHDEFIADAYKDANDLWIGESPLPMVIIYNKKLIAEDGMKIPTGWEDLLAPEWFGKIAYTLPSKSGSAYTQLCTMLLGHGGPVDGWNFIEKLYLNLDKKVLDSSSKSHKMVADGEFHAGLTLEKSAILYEDDNIGFIYPADGTSAVPDGVALVKNAPNEANAKIFIDYVLSKECQIRQSEEFGRRPVRSDVPVSSDIAPLNEIILVDYDFAWASNEKEIIIEKFNDMMVDLN